LFILEFGSLAVFAEVSLDFIPHIRPQKDLRRPADLGDLAASAFLTGGFRFIPCALAEARPLALRPPFGFLPSALCHAGDLAIYFFLPIFFDDIFAEDNAIAIACFLPLTIGPLLDPEFKVPALNSFITLEILAFLAALFIT
jgi:hypothetical protein